MTFCQKKRMLNQHGWWWSWWKTMGAMLTIRANTSKAKPHVVVTNGFWLPLSWIYITLTIYIARTSTCQNKVHIFYPPKLNIFWTGLNIWKDEAKLLYLILRSIPLEQSCRKETPTSDFPRLRKRKKWERWSQEENLQLFSFHDIVFACPQ